MTDATLLIVDDEKSTRDGLRLALEDEFDCYVASNITEAMNVLTSENVDMMLTDLRMGADNGMDLLDKALALPNPPVAIMMTAYGSVDTAVQAMHRGAWNFVTKPLNIDEVELMIKQALKNKITEKKNVVLAQENTELRKSSGKQGRGLDKLIGSSSAMSKVHDVITQVAPTKATVLIEGESGTGKELVANAIHQLSDRPNDKIVTVNCAALSSQLLESELFGHEKGSFTGATQRRIGRFEQAHRGTLFLDEIGEIDQQTQVKLLRALSEKTIERVGSNDVVKIDVRVIAATNKNLRELVEKGEFREDLFFRLNVVQVNMPPLRDRREDIILLANNFLKEFSAENKKAVKPLSESAATLLINYDWPGNVRELRTAIEHGVVMSNSHEIDTTHLPHFLNETSKLSSSKNENRNTPDDLLNLNLSNLEHQTILRALQQTKSNKTEAATLLGISRRTLQRKIKESGPLDN